MTAKRSYTDDEIAAALARLKANGGNAKRTATQLGISRTTLRQWAGLSPVKGKQVAPEKVGEHGTRLAEKLDRLSDRISERALEAIETVPLETAADLRNLLVSGGITIEKASFARGGPTSRVENLKISLISPNALRDPELKVIEGGLGRSERPLTGTDGGQ